jgi:hypothetical protein
MQRRSSACAQQPPYLEAPEVRAARQDLQVLNLRGGDELHRVVHQVVAAQAEHKRTIQRRFIIL